MPRLVRIVTLTVLVMCLLWVAGGAGITSQPAAPAPIEITFQMPPGGPWPSNARIAATGPSERREFSAPVAAVTSLEVGRHEVWTITAYAEGLWADPVAVLAPGSTTVRFLPAGAVAGSVALEQLESMPASIRVRFSSPEPGSPSGEESARIDESGRFASVVPAGRSDIRLRAEGFVSVFLWDRQIAAGVTTALGEARLVRGDSITGWLRTEDGQPLDATASVSLRPAGPPLAADARRHLRLAALDITLRPDGRGFFHFPGAAPGEYAVTASQRGYKDAFVSGVVVPRGYESKVVDDVVLTRPRRLRVEVRPASSLGGEPWLVRVVRLTAGAVSEAGSSATDSTGAALFTDLASDRHLVTVEAAGQRWASAEIDVVDREQVLDVDVPALRVEGHVYLGDEPLRHATVIFGGSSGLDSVTFHADASGAFSGHLPRPGDWAVVISADSPPVERSLRRVSVAIRPRKAYAEVEIRLPGGRLHGVVRDEGGRPASRAFVRALPLSSEDDEVATRAGEDGRFELAGLPGVPVELQAETREALSDALVLVVQEDREPDSIELVVRARRLVSGRVLGPHGPVPGASVYLRPVGETFHSGEETSTDATGSFSMHLGKGVREVFARVMASGYAFSVVRAPLPEGGELVLQVGKVMGEVELRYPAEQHASVLAVRSGAAIWLPPLLSWAGRFGGEGSYAPGRVVIPRLDAGVWSFCLLSPGTAEWAATWAWGRTAPDRCVEVVVAPGGRASADLRPPPPADPAR